MKKIVFYVPVSHVENVKTAMFSAGAGKIGLYEACSWQVLGEGQFRPVEGSTPFIGDTGALEKIEEYKVEMVCDEEFLSAAIAALKAAHPYEEPAYHVIAVLDL